VRIADIQFETGDSRADAACAGDTSRDNDTILTRLAHWTALCPNEPAVVDESGSTSYAALDTLSNRIAHWLRDAGFSSESRVAVMMGRRREYIAAAIGILKAGCTYVPLDPTQPLTRRRDLLRIAGAQAAVADRENVGDVRRLFWQCPALTRALCIDAEAPAALIENPTAVMSTELWDHIAAEAGDIEAGGWKSAFTGLPMAASAMAAFGDNARRKIVPLLDTQSRVVEIGCASGFTMRTVAPHCGYYVASDIARLNAERTEAAARRMGLDHVVGRHLASHDIDLLPAGSFDLVILNSVVESFPGFGYLESVLDKAMALLRPGGALFLGNIWDLDRKRAYISDLAAFARDHGDAFRTRLTLDDNFFVPKDFFRDWAASRSEAPSLTFSDIEAEGFDPAPYGFDLIIRLDGKGGRMPPRHALDGVDALEISSSSPCAATIRPDGAAYIMFTSGTTGQPKAALVEHRSAVNLAAAIDASLYRPMAQGRQLAITCNFAFAFDGSIHQIFTTLMNGHALHICSDEARRDPAALYDFLGRHRIDVCDATPSLFALLVDYCVDKAAPLPVRRVILGGEVIRAETLRRFYELPGHRDVSVVNQYGPSETCVCATQHIMTAASWAEHLPSPIGLPLDGVTVRLVDSKGRDMPDGVPGEIWIGGVQVARGYHGDPERTAERFVTDAKGRRFYRTGDLARRLRNGLLQFAGREDRQVKIRGHRVELGELEARLGAHPLVRQVVAAAQDLRDAGDKELVAYVVPRSGFDPAQARMALEAIMPAWFVPSHIVTLEKLPLTANGKLDEARLPRPEIRTVTVVQSLATETERRMADVWADVLDRPIEDAAADFFLSGGHSVLAVRLLSKVEAAFSVRLPLSELFVHTTVAAMARLVENRRDGAAWQPVVAIHEGGGRVPLVCFHPVGGNVLCYRQLADALGPDQPVYMIQSYGLEDGQTLLDSVEAQAGAYLKALRPILRDRPIAVAGWSFGGLLAWEAACQLHRSGADLRAVIVLDGIAAPEPVRELLMKDEADYLAALFGEMGLFDAEMLRPLTPEQRIDLILERGKGGHFLPDDMDRPAMRRLLALFQNNGLAAVRYQPRPYEGRLLLVRPRQPSSQAPGIPGDPLNGWGGLAAAGVALRWMDGTHGQMLNQPWLGTLADHVRQWLDAVNR
jgi:amino acid adenylation domain-containing protein